MPVVAPGSFTMRPRSTVPTATPLPSTAVPDDSGTVAIGHDDARRSNPSQRRERARAEALRGYSAHMREHSAGAPAIVDRSRDAFGGQLDNFCRGAHSI